MLILYLNFQKEETIYSILIGYKMLEFFLNFFMCIIDNFDS